MKLKKKMQTSVIALLEKRYGGIRDVVKLLDRIRDNVETQKIKGLTDKEDDIKPEGEDIKPTVEQVDGEQTVITVVEANGKETKVKANELDSKPNVTNHAINENNTTDDNTGEDEDNNETTIFKPDDGKWRPVVLTLGLVYKLQKVTDDDWYDVESVFMHDKEKITNLVELVAHYWWHIMEVAKHLKGDEDSIYENISSGLKVKQEDVLYAYVKDAERALVSEHCPDISLVVHHESKEVILVVCGTKMFPAPSAADIMMDLYAESVPFFKGRAHGGMVAATNNILTMIMDTLVERLADLPDYKLVVLGYSLGAGVAQLLTIRLTDGEEKKRIPAHNQVMCITFGSPPVYHSDEPGYINNNVISVYNHNDGLASLSLHTVTKLFLQIRAINRICLGRRKTLKLLRTKLGESMTEEGGTKVRRFVRSRGAAKPEEWDNVTTAVDAVTQTGFARLGHFAGFTYLIKRGDGGDNVVPHIVRLLPGEKAQNLVRELRLRGGMFNDHMPWGYARLFKDCGGNCQGLSLDLLRYL